MSRLRNLAYGRSFSADRHCRVFLGEDREAWNRCGRESQLGWRDLLLLPTGQDPQFSLWPVKGLDVMIFNFNGCADTSRIHNIIHSCLEAGAGLVTACMRNDTLMVQNE